MSTKKRTGGGKKSKDGFFPSPNFLLAGGFSLGIHWEKIFPSLVWRFPNRWRKEGGGSFMKPELAETAWAREMKKKVEEEMARREMETILYWKGEVDKILVKRPESLATFQIEVRNLLQRMLNRIRVLKTSLPG
jgi:hypothetical protein